MSHRNVSFPNLGPTPLPLPLILPGTDVVCNIMCRLSETNRNGSICMGTEGTISPELEARARFPDF